MIDPCQKCLWLLPATVSPDDMILPCGKRRDSNATPVLTAEKALELMLDRELDAWIYIADDWLGSPRYRNDRMQIAHCEAQITSSMQWRCIEALIVFVCAQYVFNG